MDYSCISFYSYIKPQLQYQLGVAEYGCISFYSYIKPQQLTRSMIFSVSCISFYSYIKPQRERQTDGDSSVVYRSIPTSNRNLGRSCQSSTGLYIVLFLHQTATFVQLSHSINCCISFYSYIKPQPYSLNCP